MHLLLEDGRYEQRRLGVDPEAGEAPQVIMPHGCWFGATVDRGDYILVGCTVFPGFDFADFELGERESLASLYPRCKGIIDRLCGDQRD
jgi:predicted cupin superfamily sugar epimerase